MTRSTAIIMILVVAAASLATVVQVKRLGNSQSRLESAREVLQTTVRDSQEVFSLRHRQERIAFKQRPTQDVIALVNAALAEVGIPAQRLKTLIPESDSTIAQLTTGGTSGAAAGENGTNGLYKRQSLRIALDNLTVRELGAFLLQWRQSQQIWTVSRIELTHVRGGNSAGKATAPTSQAAEDRYDVGLLISAIYIDQA